LALVLLLGVCAIALAGEDEAPTDPEAAVRARIAEFRNASRSLVTDGRGDDWKKLHSISDPRGDAKPSDLDIVTVAVAPRAADIVVLVGTATKPETVNGSFLLEVDFLGLSAWDLRVTPLVAGGCIVEFLVDGVARSRESVATVESAFGAALEVRIPIPVIATRYPESMARALVTGVRRPWVRVRATSLNAMGAVVDRGPAVASYLLVDVPGPLDAAAPLPEAHARPVPLPVEGEWFVRQGGFGLWSHREQWAYDFSMVDATLHSGPPGSTKPRDYFAWRRIVRAPEAGRIVFAEGESPDNVVGGPAPELDRASAETGNKVMIRFEDGLRLYVDHLAAKSVAVEKGEEVTAGSTLGAVGNSGVSGAPHLHLALHDRPGEFRGLPLTLKNVRVSLNPGPDDPWSRDLPSWEVREGLFVSDPSRAPRR
jgi:hypothetical protein